MEYYGVSLYNQSKIHVKWIGKLFRLPFLLSAIVTLFFVHCLGEIIQYHSKDPDRLMNPKDNENYFKVFPHKFTHVYVVPCLSTDPTVICFQNLGF